MLNTRVLQLFRYHAIKSEDGRTLFFAKKSSDVSVVLPPPSPPPVDLRVWPIGRLDEVMMPGDDVLTMPEAHRIVGRVQRNAEPQKTARK
jgi:hypothetical protein